MQIIKGDLVLLSAQEYSDYSILDTFKARKDFDTSEVIQEFMLCFKTIHPEDDEEEELYNGPEYDEFQLWLINAKYIKELITKEWHIGSYGRFDS